MRAETALPNTFKKVAERVSLAHSQKPRPIAGLTCVISPGSKWAREYGYAHTSTDDQTTALQLARSNALGVLTSSGQGTSLAHLALDGWSQARLSVLIRRHYF